MKAACVAFRHLVSICFAALFATGFASADDWPHWRGLNRNGVIQDPSGWNGSSWVNPKPAWETDVGEGASSPLLVGGHVYALGHQDGRNIVSCLDAETGGTVWEKSYKTSNYGRNAIGDEGLYSGPSSTPEFDPATHLLYTLSSDGDLHCWNCQQDGLAVWHRNLYDDYDMPRRAKVGRSGRRDYGYTSSPLIYRDWVLVEAGGPAGTIVAFEKLSGKEVWRSEAKSVAGHTGGMSLITVEGIDCIAAMTLPQGLGRQAQDGAATKAPPHPRSSAPRLGIGTQTELRRENGGVTAPVHPRSMSAPATAQAGDLPRTATARCSSTRVGMCTK